ncbi:flagellar hook assembly protein FlgD [Parasphingorhabdus cellanae]|uniref:Basal-body rod modification protein FlgD n=1 Tax=Parasphingorhabdus cellanae TaxID=2806553 RepID=A0ABX7T4I2_9SPHN|nr:flagellar hook capping FlgD N-terminal domain-containing protein [Parasphingorhabdus cellanae]QTD56494.1 flagellar hook capping protein [Parasphingorhabdus cellanae]
MTSISDIASSNSGTAGTSPLSGSNLDQAAFLRLMTAQLKMQDPFKPLDSNDMVAQMAQFSTVAGIEEMNGSLKKLYENNRIGDASSWLGRNVLVPGNMAVPNEAGQYAGEFYLTAPAEDLSIDFLNDRGEIVQAIELGEQKAGPIVFEWDALDGNGKPLEHGPLKVRVNGGVIAGLSSWTIVEAVQSPTDGANARLITSRGEFWLSDAIRLR